MNKAVKLGMFALFFLVIIFPIRVSADDAYFDGTSKNFTDNGDGTVTDEHTGLMWRYNFQEIMYWYDAFKYCGNLVLCEDETWDGDENAAGSCSGDVRYGDWRLPTSYELLAMLDFGCDNGDAGCNSDFENDALNWSDGYPRYWSGTTRSDNPNEAYTIYTDHGGGNDHSKVSSTYHFRCVRSDSFEIHSGQSICFDSNSNEVNCNSTYEGQDGQADPVNKSYIDNGDGTVTDDHTGIMWQQNDSEAGDKNWSESLDYCNNLKLCNDGTFLGDENAEGNCSLHGGTKYNDWRLPNLYELNTLVDYGCSSSGSGCNSDFENDVFEWNAEDSGYWSSTTMADDPAKSYAASFDSGSMLQGVKTGEGYVRCLRGVYDSNNFHTGQQIVYYNNYDFSVIEPIWPTNFDLYDTDGDFIGSTTTETTLQLRKNNYKKVEFNIDSDVDLSSVIVDADSEKTVISNLQNAPGVTGNHSLFIPNVNSEGIYICPDAETLSAVTESCSNIETFNHTECDNGASKTVGTDTVTCTIVDAGSTYKAAGLTSSGGGNLGGAGDGGAAQIPEFSTWAMIVSLAMTIFGMFLMKNKEVGR